MGYYPIFVEMRGRRALLVGGGHVALEKIGKLVDAEAGVTIVAPELIPPVAAFVDDGRVTLLQRSYEPGDVQGFDMVMVATDDGAVNAQVAAEARAAGIWVNAADDVANCDFILPGLAKRGRIAIATSTGGSSPALARWLRERMEDFLSDEVVALGDLLAEVRVQARARDRECDGNVGYDPRAAEQLGRCNAELTMNRRDERFFAHFQPRFDEHRTAGPAGRGGGEIHGIAPHTRHCACT